MEIQKGQFDETPFSTILNSEILTVDELQSLEPLKEELKETFIKSQVFRTRTEMEVSVLNDIKHPTPASKYWQSVREQNVMFNELVSLSFEYRKNLVKIKMVERELENETDELKKELLKIKLEEKNFGLRHQEKTAKDRIREIKAWSEIKEREASQMSAEELSDVDNHQLMAYTQRWIKQSLIAGNSGSPSEKNNLMGQLRSGIKACKEAGIIEKVLEPFDKEIKKQLNGNSIH